MSDDDARLEPRTEDLEVRMAFLEKTVQDLDEVVREAFDEIAKLRRQLQDLEDQVKKGDEAEIEVGSLEDERPPHY